MEETTFVAEAAVRSFVLNLQARKPALTANDQLESLIEFQGRTDSALTKEARDYLTRQIKALKELIGGRITRIEVGSTWVYGDCKLIVVARLPQDSLRVHLHHKGLFPLTVHIDEGQFRSLAEDGNIEKGFSS